MDGSWRNLEGLHKHWSVLIEAGGLLGAVMGFGLAVSGASAHSQCQAALGRASGSHAGGLSPWCPVTRISQGSVPVLPVVQTQLCSFQAPQQ